MTTHLVALGVNDYRSPVSPLKCCLRDAREVVAVFKERFGFNALLVESPTLEALISSLRRLERELKSGDTFVFYFSGHGKSHQEDHFLLLPDVDLDDLAESPAGTSGVGVISYLHLKRLTARAAWNGVKRLFILDACRTPIIEDKAGRPAVFDAEFLLKDIRLTRRIQSERSKDAGLTVVNSCDHGASASELAVDGHGLFTAAFLDCAREAESLSGSLIIDGQLCEALGAEMNRRAMDAKLPKAVWHRPVVGGDPLELRSMRSRRQSDEATEWDICKAMPTVESLQAFIRGFPRSVRKGKALDMLRQLAADRSEAVLPPAAVSPKALRKVSLYPTRSQLKVAPAAPPQRPRQFEPSPPTVPSGGRDARGDACTRDDRLWALVRGEPSVEHLEQYLREASADAPMREEAKKQLQQLQHSPTLARTSNGVAPRSEEPKQHQSSEWEPDPTPQFLLSLDKVSDFITRKGRRKP